MIMPANILGMATGEGNKADWYYQWDSIYKDVIAKGYTPEVISDYFAGKKDRIKMIMIRK